ncbi:MAG: exodeoxyribonuclease VII small subunit [Armatimonadota bacterium]|nr:exodeoxyribonuclease VII small subunit [Armatimonadota bacterium]
MNIEHSAGRNGTPRHNSAVNITVIEESTTGPSPEETPLSFEEALRELEEVVTTLETGNVPIEQAIAQLQRGLALAEQCDATLAKAEATLEQLIASPDGELIVEPMDEDEDDTPA